MSLREDIIEILQKNNGSVSEEYVCNKLNIEIKDVPYGYKVGWSRCLQPDQTFHLFINGDIDTPDKEYIMPNFNETGKCCS
jgi:hypothetical protein